MTRETKAARLEREIDRLYVELRKHQERCKHPVRHRFYILRGSSGNYDPSNDGYWTAYECRLCRKKWIVSDQRNLVGTRI